MSKEQPILVAIHCLVYNHEPYLCDCLEGFVMQKTNFRFVAIVHDDVSTDKSAEIIREYAEKYPDIIKPIFETENQYFKPGRALDKIMNDAIDSTSAKYVAMCEGDDYWTDPYKLQKQVNLLEEHPAISICINQVRTVSRNKELLDTYMPSNDIIKQGVFSLEDFCRLEWGNMQWVFHFNGFMCRKEYAVDWLQNDVLCMIPYGDMPLLLYCLLQGNGYYIHEQMSCYRVDSGGFNTTISANPLRSIQTERKLAFALQAFDEYTHRQYHKYIQQRIRLCEYREYTLGKKSLWKILLPKYWKCIPGKTARKKMLNVIEIISPQTRRFLKILKQR